METIIYPNCVATDGKKFYGHFVTTLGGIQSVVLVESNANPATISDISWTVVSIYPQSKLYYLQGLASLNSFSCNVDSNGVFTILAFTSKINSVDQTLSQPRGYQYIPSTSSWRNIDVSNGYHWNVLSESVMVSVPNGGSNVLMHIYSTGNVVSTVSIAIFNEAQTTFVQQNTTWSVAEGIPFGFASNNNDLYVLSKDFTKTTYLNIMPLNPTATPPSNSSIRVLQAPASINNGCGLIFASVLRTAVLGSNYYMLCSDGSRNINYLATSDGTNITEAYQLLTAVQYPEAFIPFAGGSGGASAWAFMTNSTKVFGLGLSGADRGIWDYLSFNLNTTGLPANGTGSGGTGSSSSGTSGTGTGSGGSGGSGGLSQSVLIAVIAVCVVLLGGAVAIVYLKRRSNKKNAQENSSIMVNGAPFEYKYQPPFLQPQIFQPQEQQQQQQEQQQQGVYQSPVTTSDHDKVFTPLATAAQVTPINQYYAQNPQEYPMLNNNTLPGPQSNMDPNIVATWSPALSNGTTIHSANTNNPQLYTTSTPMSDNSLDQRNPQSFHYQQQVGAAPHGLPPQNWDSSNTGYI